ncbi:MAG: hypothetical protein SCK70_15525 [bacterium]|nr:hypothetical protein [bacterium]
MASYYKFKCNNCKFEVTVSGPHEFKFENGVIKALPHPGDDEPADGLYLNVYCPHCDKNLNLTRVEYIEPAENPFETNVENIKEEYLNNYSAYIKDYPQKTKIPTECFNLFALKCPCCDNDVLYYPGHADRFHCPKCKNGKFEFDINFFMIT